MPANKAPRKKKPTRVRRNPSGILNRLTMPDDRIHRLKKRADAELMRLYMRSGDYSDIVSLSTTLALGRVMLKFVDDPEPIRAWITDARDALAAYDPTAEVINLDAVRDALDLCYRVWRLVSVNEFVAAAAPSRRRPPERRWPAGPDAPQSATFLVASSTVRSPRRS